MFNLGKKKPRAQQSTSNAGRAYTYVRQYVLAMRHGHLAGASQVTDNTLAPGSRLGVWYPKKINSLVPGIPESGIIFLFAYK